MAEITGYFLDQKVETVANNDTDINAAIDAGASEDPKWVVTNLFLFPTSEASVIILFTRQRVVV